MASAYAVRFFHLREGCGGRYAVAVRNAVKHGSEANPVAARPAAVPPYVVAAKYYCLMAAWRRGTPK